MTSPQSDNPAGIQCLAIDLGAGSGRLVVGRIADGRWSLKEIGRFRTPTRIDSKSGYQYWDTEKILSHIGSHLAQASETGAIASLGVDSWGVDYVLLDDRLRTIGVPVCYRDDRTAGGMEFFHRRVPQAEIYRRTGIQFLSFNTLYQLAACGQQQPGWIETARHFLMIPDYLHFRLSGILSNEYTNATTTQMCGLDGEWDDLLCEAAGIQRSWMLSPIAAGTVLGDGKGIAAEIKVIAPATHDTASAIAGTPLESVDEAYISSGTWSLMGVESMVPIATEEALRMNFTNEGGIERRFRVLKNIMGMWPIQRVCEEQCVSDFPALVRDAAAAEPWRSIIDVNDSDFLNPTSMTESIRGYCANSGEPIPETLTQIARCVFDSLALSYRKVKHQLETLRGRKLDRIRIVGGGCQNALLNQLCADACELPVIAGPVEASVLGNLSAQMIALGMLENLTAARALIRASLAVDTYLPRDVVPAQVLDRLEGLWRAKETKGQSCV